MNLDLDNDIPESLKSFKTDRLGAQAAPADLKEEMQAYFDEHYELAELQVIKDRTQLQVIKDNEYVQASRFLDEFRYTAAGREALSVAPNLKQGNQQLNACFAALHPKHFKPQVACGLRKVIVGAKRKRAVIDDDNMDIDGHI